MSDRYKPKRAALYNKKSKAYIKSYYSCTKIDCKSVGKYKNVNLLFYEAARFEHLENIRGN